MMIKASFVVNKIKMNTVTILRYPTNFLKFFHNLSNILQCHILPAYSTNSNFIETLSSETLTRFQGQTPILCQSNIKSLDSGSTVDLTTMSSEELEKYLLELSMTNKNQTMFKIIAECIDKKRYITKLFVRKLLNTYSTAGNVEIVKILLNYCSLMLHDHYISSGKFLHYLGKAQCMKGNSEKGLSIIKDCYTENVGMRGVYRMVLRELIHDSVMNRSEATLVVVSRHVLEYSDHWNDSYPIVCLWHICWISSWFSDQQLASELLDKSDKLRAIVKDKALTFSVSILKDNNEDAAVRLLQYLLKYNMMEEYIKVLQVLFSYKLRNHDLRGCREIVNNCEALGITLSPSHQGKYVCMLIHDKTPKTKDKKLSIDFKLKF